MPRLPLVNAALSPWLSTSPLTKGPLARGAQEFFSKSSWCGIDSVGDAACKAIPGISTNSSTQKWLRTNIHEVVLLSRHGLRKGRAQSVHAYAQGLHAHVARGLHAGLACARGTPT